MSKQRASVMSLVVFAVASLAFPSVATAQQQQRRATTTTQKAGTISALLPSAKILRGRGRNVSTLEAAKGAEVVWDDLVRTEKGGRARVTLNDQSILSIGSQAELRIVKHDARSQQTALELAYGRVRAQVATVTRDGGSFALRTPTAVAGVIGTDFGTTSSFGLSEFICISGTVSVNNSDPKVPGTVSCTPGMTTSVSQGQAPTAPQPASQQQIQQLIADTEPAIISALSPASALLGTTVETVVTGTKMQGINQVSVSGEGVQAVLQPGGTETSVTVSITVTSGAAAGPRTITFTKPNGQATAAIFTVLAPPSATTSTDFAVIKKQYLEVLDTRRQAEIIGLNAIGLGLQQSIEQAGQQISQANNRLTSPLAKFGTTDSSEMNQYFKRLETALAEALVAAGTEVNTEAATAARLFNDDFDAAQRALVSRVPSGAPDQAFQNDVNAALAKAMQSLKARLESVHNTLGAGAKRGNEAVLTYTDAALKEIERAAVAQLLPPTPGVANPEVQVDAGAPVSLDASRSTAVSGASIVSTRWTLCAAGYRPAQVGVTLPENAPGCSPLSGYQSSNSEFKFESCQLDPNEYIARVFVTDSNGKTSAMDVKVNVLAPGYDGPEARMRGLADAYVALQSESFLRFFDENFSGLTALQENIRRTFQALNSMSINLRVSQAEVRCNEARVRADWLQKYTFREDRSCEGVVGACERVVFSQEAQLTARMVREPGRGWFITEFQGDNGTVQGAPPGPRQVDTARPDLQVVSVEPTSGVAASSRTVMLAGANGSEMAAARNVAISTATGVAPGNNTFRAVISNVGDAALTQSAVVRFSLRDDQRREISFVEAPLPVPLAAGAQTSVQAQLTIPDLPPGTPGDITVVVNPGCRVDEKLCDGANIRNLAVLIGTIDIEVQSFTASSLLATQPGSATVNLRNLGSRASIACTGCIGIALAGSTTPLGTANLPSIPAGGSTSVTINFTVPANLSGSTSFVVRHAATLDTNPANDSATASFNVTPAVIDLEVQSFSASGTLTATQPATVTVNVRNLGNITSQACAQCLGIGVAGTTTPLGVTGLPAIAPGASATATLQFTVPAQLSGSVQFEVKSVATPDTNLANNAITSALNVVAASVDLQLMNLAFGAGAPPFLSGEQRSVTFVVRNVGTVASATNNAYACRLESSRQTGVVTVPLSGPTPLPSIPAGTDSALITVNFTVPTNSAGSHSLVCALTQDQFESANSLTNNQGSLATTINPNVDLQLGTAPLPAALQMGSTVTINVPVNNAGLDTASAGFDVVVTLNGTAIGSTTVSSPLAGGANLMVAVPVNVPQLQAAPADITANLAKQVNANLAVAETNTGNNTATASTRVVDLLLTRVPTGTLFAVYGRPFTAQMVTIQPLNYPLPVNVQYSPALAGLVPSGPNGTSLSGTPTGTTPTIENTVAVVTVEGVTRSSSPVAINLATELAGTVGATPSLTPASGGGPLRPLSVTVSGGVYPVQATLSTVQGISSSNPLTQTLTAPGTVTWNVQADLTAAAGSNTLMISIADNGSGSNTPPNTINVPATVSVGGVVDLGIAIAYSGVTPPFLSGQSVTLAVTLQNAGNVASGASNTQTCVMSAANTPITLDTRVIPALGPATSGTSNITFTVPTNNAGARTITCSLTADVSESNTTNNSAALAAQVNPNIDLQVTSVTIPGPAQAGSNKSLSFTVQNTGLDTAIGNWSIVAHIGGVEVLNTTSSVSINGASSMPMTLSPVTIPSVGTAPYDLTPAVTVAVNGNAAIPETNTSNNSGAGTLRVLDYTLQVLPSGTQTGVVGRAFDLAAVQVNPLTYPAPPGPPNLALSMSNVPAGLAQTGPFGTRIQGTPGASSAGSYTVAVSAAADGVTKTAPAISLQILPEIAIAQTATPTLTAGGGSQPLTVSVTGGVFPVSIVLTLPSGISTGDPLSVALTGPGSITWNVSANNSAATGSQTMVVTATDGGISATGTPAGAVSFAAAYSVNALPNFTIGSVQLVGRTAPVGAEAIQLGESVIFRVVVNNIGNASPTGTVQVQMTCNSESCSPPLSATAAAPAAGQSVTVDLPASMDGFLTGSYIGSASVSSAISESTTADNSGTMPFDVFDFSITHTFPEPTFGRFNVLAGGTTNFPMTLNMSTPGPTTLPVAVTPVDANASYSFTNPASAGALPVQLTVNSSHPTGVGADVVLSVQATNRGVTRDHMLPLRFFTASLQNISTGQPGSSSGNPIELPVGGSAQVLDMRLAGDFVGTSSLVMPTVTGYTASPSTGVVNANDTFQLNLAAVAGATADVVTPLTITAQIPDSHPPVSITTTVFVVARTVTDLSVVPPTNTSRDFNASPWVSGEPQDFTITVTNSGTSPSAGGENVTVLLNNVQVDTFSVPALAAGASQNFTRTIVAPDFMPFQVSTVQVTVDPSASGDGNHQNNTASAGIKTADWQLVVTGVGESDGNAIALTPGGASSTGTVTAVYMPPAPAGTIFPAVSLSQGMVSNRIAMTGLPQTTTAGGPQTGSVSVFADSQATNGDYLAQVIGSIGGSSVRKQALFHMDVISGPVQPSVVITPNPNAINTPVQLNGVIPKTIDLTVTRSGCTPGACAGAVDLHFTDDSGVVSLPSAARQQLLAVPYDIPQTVDFAAEEFSGGFLSPGPANVIVSATAAQTSAVRTNPATPPVGTNNITLQFNVGDLNLAPTGCIALPPGATTSMTITWVPVSGFNAPQLDWQWSSFNGLVTIDVLSGQDTLSGGVYGSGSRTFNLTNNNTSNLGEQVFVFRVTVTENALSADKFFSIPVQMSAGACVAGAAPSEGNGGAIRGVWRQAPAVSSASASRARMITEGGLPDVQFDTQEVSVTPSVPVAGDTVHVRFKLSNAGKADAKDVTVALLMDGQTVATDTFSVAAGRSTLAGLSWNSSENMRAGAGGSEGDNAGGLGQLSLVIDPARTTRQQSQAGKTLVIRSVPLRVNPEVARGVGVIGEDQTYLEISESACAGFRFSSGMAGSCETADLNIMAEEIANRQLAFLSDYGVADLGMLADARTARVDAAAFSDRAVAQVGHTYAVKMASGRVGLLTLKSIKTFNELDAKARKLFERRARRVIRNIGGDTGPVETGDTSGHDLGARIYLEVAFRLR